uniref:4-hydroxy-2-oxovalerate aldolase n=1 Tax=Rhodococcus jostii (strain RHA1) TaxID=101510 RepID=Q8KZT0_RHOJR|nr:4-hydroxy-2-oxovalerate aldolase [Rhodococcus jostii RHA1]
MTRPELRDDVRIVDTTLRDGSHAQSHQFTESQVRDTVRALDGAGVEVIEVTHGDGLGGSTFNYGFSRISDLELVQVAADTAEQAKIAVLLVPGIGTADDLRKAADRGAEVVRIATHCTEADVSLQHFEIARDLGMQTCGFLMMAHRTTPEELARQARLMVDAGCQVPYVTDSAGALLMHEAKDRFDALITEVGDDAWVGYHGHQNMSLGVANSVIAYEAGVRYIDGSLCALGAGSGNSPTELLAAIFDRMNIRDRARRDGDIGCSRDSWCGPTSTVGRKSIGMRSCRVGSAWYSSFLLHAGDRGRPVWRSGARESCVAAANWGYVGGQEDMIIDVAIQLAKVSGHGIRAVCFSGRGLIA